MEGELNDPRYGPYIAAAFFCEKILTERDGVISAIRIIDRLTFNIQPGSGSSPKPYSFNLFISLKTGERPGVTKIRIEGRKPNPPHLPNVEKTIHLDQAASSGANLHIGITVDFDQPGVWWFWVYVNEHERTRVPLEVIWLPLS